MSFLSIDGRAECFKFRTSVQTVILLRFLALLALKIGQGFPCSWHGPCGFSLIDRFFLPDGCRNQAFEVELSGLRWSSEGTAEVHRFLYP